MFAIKSNVNYKVYKINQQIGQGTEGSVYLGQDKNKDLVAIKFQSILNQKETLEKLSTINFTNIINIKEIIYIQDGVCIVMDYANGEFYNYMQTDQYKKKSYSEKTELFLQIVKGVEELHKQQMIHRDLKPENILFIVQNNQLQLKLCDFGLIKYKPENIYKTANIGTPYYWAPELVSYDYQSKYTETVDIWALGMIWIEMLTGKPLFNFILTAEEMKNHLQKLSQPQLNSLIDNIPQIQMETKEILKQKILLIDQTLRISAKEIQIMVNQTVVKQPPFVNVFKTGQQQILPQFPQNKPCIPNSSVSQPIIPLQINQKPQQQNESNQNPFSFCSNFNTQIQYTNQQLPNIQIKTLQHQAQGFQSAPFNNTFQSKTPNSLGNSQNIQTEIQQNRFDNNQIRSKSPLLKAYDQQNCKITQLQQNQLFNEEKHNLAQKIQQYEQRNQELENQIRQKDKEIEDLKNKNLQEVQSFQDKISKLELELQRIEDVKEGSSQNEQLLYRVQIQFLQQQSLYIKSCIEKINLSKHLSIVQPYKEKLQRLQNENQKQLEDYFKMDARLCSYDFFKQQKQINDEIRNERQLMKLKINDYEKASQCQLESQRATIQLSVKQLKKKQKVLFLNLLNQITLCQKYQGDPLNVQNFIQSLLKLQKKLFKKIDVMINQVQQAQQFSKDLKVVEKKCAEDFDKLGKQINDYLENLRRNQQQQLQQDISIITNNLRGLFDLYNMLPLQSQQFNYSNKGNQSSKFDQQMESLKTGILKGLYSFEEFAKFIRKQIGDLLEKSFQIKLDLQENSK